MAGFPDNQHYRQTPIGREFDVSPTAIDSIAISFLVSLAVFIPASGWLGDRFGGKRVLLTTDLSWRWVFYVNLPIGAAAFMFGAVNLRCRATGCSARATA